jgi:S-adenosylmethionine-diacylglycerol 3-amino-3-carboxypropyl transferase
MDWCIGSGVVYNVSWEDCRVDCELLAIRPKQRDTVLMLTSGGCNVLDMALEGAEKVVAADLNPHQNALLELKCAAIELLTHEEFFRIFALSDFALFQRVYAESLRARLGEPARKIWDANSGFFKNVMWGGSSGFAARAMINAARALFGIGPLIDAAKECETLEEQVALYRANEARVAALCGFVNAMKPLVSPFIAVPASQLALFRGDICRHVLDNLFLNTHIKKDNYFYYGEDSSAPPC